MQNKAAIVTTLLVLFCFAPLISAAPVLQNGSFETPLMPTNSYCYFPSGPVTCASAFDHWTGSYQEGNGANGFGATHYDGAQALILQNASFATQTFVAGAGAFRLTWFDLQRPDFGDDSAYEIFVDGISVGTVTPIRSWTERTLQTAIGSGTHTLTFQGVARGGDSTVFIDSVSADAPAVPEPSTLSLAAFSLGSVAFFLRRRRKV